MKVVISKSGVFIPEWNNNKKLKKEEQVKVFFDYLTTEQRNSIFAGNINKSYADLAKEVYLLCIKKIENLKAEIDGIEKELDYKEILELPAFFELFSEIASEMITNSALKEEDKKKSK